MEELDEIVARFEKAVEDLKLNQKETATKVEETPKRWRAEIMDTYLYVDSYCDIKRTYETKESFEDRRHNIGNYFKTEKEAEQKIEHLKIEQQLKDIALRLNNGVEIDWEDEDQRKYWLYYDFEDEEVLCSWHGIEKTQGTTYCLDSNFKNTAIQEIGEDRLKNYLKES